MGSWAYRAGLSPSSCGRARCGAYLLAGALAVAAFERGQNPAVLRNDAARHLGRVDALGEQLQARPVPAQHVEQLLPLTS